MRSILSAGYDDLLPNERDAYLSSTLERYVRARQNLSAASDTMGT